MPLKSSLPICTTEEKIYDDVLLKPAGKITFPLKSEIIVFIDEFIKKFKETENCAGLAAPQVGQAYKIIIVHVLEEFHDYRDDVHDIVPMTVFINPEYEGVGDEKVADWEACFSVSSQAGKVRRFKKIKFKAQDIEGNPIEREVEGFYARLLQHETDHVNGTLITSRFEDDLPHGSREEMNTLREERASAKRNV